MLNELDKEMERLGLKFVRYADDFSIYCKTKSDAVKANRLVIKFLKDKLKLPINTDKSGIRRPVHLQVLGFGFIRKYVLFNRVLMIASQLYLHTAKARKVNTSL
jgi:hypothetical protein